MDKQYEVIHIPEIERRTNVLDIAVARLENSVTSMQPISANVSNLFTPGRFGFETEPTPPETITPPAAQDELSAKREEVEASYDIAA